MSDLTVEVDPVDVGLDIGRLERIAQHFRTYVADGRLAGWLVSVAREGKVAYLALGGMRDLEEGTPVEPGTIWRIYSMTKPITSLAVMMLYEEGAFDLRDPVEAYLPSFAGARVHDGGDPSVTVPLTAPVRLWHLLTHTSGLSYGGTDHPVDAAYREATDAARAEGAPDLAEMVDLWASQPLVFQPGEHWRYSVATDVLGRLVEVVSGQSLDTFFSERILRPLGMLDTSFAVGGEKLDRLASLYVPDPATRRAVPAPDPRATRSSPFLSGGGGLLSTAADYHRFCRFLLGGGELEGVRLISPKTLAFMTTNQLPDGRGLEELAAGGFSETSWEGMGFGFGFSVVLDPTRTKVLGSRGEFGWGGRASTVFWVDPTEALSVSFFTQLDPSTAWPIRPRLHQLVYQALTEPS